MSDVASLGMAVLWLLLGAALGACVALVVSARRTDGRSGPDAGARDEDHPVPPAVNDVLTVLRSVVVVVDGSDKVVRSNDQARALGLVRGPDLAHDEMRAIVRQVRRDRVVREIEMELPRGPSGQGRLTLGVRVAALGEDLVLVMVDDRSHSRRVEETRRDFVVNVSHELKTPVGGLSLLAEAVQDARDDPEAVNRFAARMQVETQRLARLVQEIVDLSRLQVADTLHEPALVEVNRCVQDAVHHVEVVASDRDVDLVTALADPSPLVYGDRDLITTAVRNLVANAISYSGEHTRVGIAVRRVDDFVEISVTDQGLGIAPEEQQRIFERFYRVDAARSRSTGGTGLGLAIVKHVCVNHGGEVDVWSEPGHGSTFTMRIPLADADEGTSPDDATPVRDDDDDDEVGGTPNGSHDPTTPADRAAYAATARTPRKDLT